MYGTFLFGEAPPGVCPNIVGEGLFFNSEVLRINSIIDQLLMLTSGIDATSIVLESYVSNGLKLDSEVYQTIL